VTLRDRAAELVAHINGTHGLDLELVSAVAAGETRSAHVLRDTAGDEWVLKWSRASEDSPENLRQMVAIVDRLREDGYPAPEHLVVGVMGTTAYWIQERLAGEPIHLVPTRLSEDDHLVRFIPELLRLNDLQAGKGLLGAPPWPDWLLVTLDRGGDGYCLHATMASRPETAVMLEQIKSIADRCRRAPSVSTDIVHFDFSYANVLTDGAAITGVIDWNVPFLGAGQGDRGFDVATLLFYAYDRPRVRQMLWESLLERTTEPWAAIFLAHLTLRQVEWCLRFYPETAEEARFLAIGRAVLDDVLTLLTAPL